MAIRLEKGQKIDLRKHNGTCLTKFCVGCNWGAIESRKFFGLFKDTKDVDLDLSCLLFDSDGNCCDHIYSPAYRADFLSKFGLPKGKLDSRDGALHHSGDDRHGDVGGDDGLDNEIISVDLTRISPVVNSIVFFLNNCGGEDFSQIPYASIRMFEGTPERVKEVFASYDVAASSEYAGKKAQVMGKLYKRNEKWRFSAIGDAFPDPTIVHTIARILKDYSK